MTVEIATPSEVATFATPNPNGELIAKMAATWDRIMDPSRLYYLPLEIDSDDPESAGRLYMEGGREEEPWLAGVIPAFSSVDDLALYIEFMCRERDRDTRDYSGWCANFELIHKTMPSINQQWRDSGETKDLRVELHLFEKNGNMTFGDILWDCSTV